MDACAIVFSLVKVGVKNTAWHRDLNIKHAKEGGNPPKETLGKKRVREGKAILSAKEILLQFEA